MRFLITEDLRRRVAGLFRDGLTVAEVSVKTGLGKTSCWNIGAAAGVVRSKTRHAAHGSGAHGSWRKMRERCLNPKCPAYRFYGARGISIDERWLSFENFYRDMGERPPGTSLDRINPLGNYEPGNCRWATWDIQKRNQRHALKHNGEYVSAIAEQRGIPMSTVRSRLKRGESLDAALSGRYRPGYHAGRVRYAKQRAMGQENARS